jgi:RNase P/RNase MRP subunit p30
MNFYCDLCLTKKDEASNVHFNELISCAILDNYQIISINQTRKGIIPEEKKTNINNNNNKINKELIQELYTKNSLKFLNVQKKDLINWDKIKIFNRLTIEISEQKEIFQLTKPNNYLKSFDILAVRPKNDKILESCLTSELNCDIIAIDLYEKFSFMSKKKLFQTAADKGMFFEIEYGKFITDNESRSNFISNFILLNQVLKGNNLIISSGAENVFMQRNPEDIIIILETIFDIKKHMAYKMITENPIKALLKSKQRKLFKTTLGIINSENNK